MAEREAHIDEPYTVTCYAGYYLDMAKWLNNYANASKLELVSLTVEPSTGWVAVWRRRRP